MTHTPEPIKFELTDAHAFDRERLSIPVWDDLPPETHIEYHDLARAVLMVALTPRIVDGPEMDKP